MALTLRSVRTASAALLALALAVIGGLVVASPAAAAVLTYKIMPLGDSITRGVGQDGCSDSNPAGCKAWRVRLSNHLDSAAVGTGNGTDTWDYDYVGSMTAQPSAGYNHEGHGGWTIQQIYAQIDTWQATYAPDIILLHIGTNNITAGETAATVQSRLETLLNKIRTNQSNVRVFVSRIIPVNHIWATTDEETRNVAYANAVGAAITNVGGATNKFYPVDVRDIGQDGMYDWHHPNEMGYIKIAYKYYEAMRGIVNLSNYWGTVSNPYTWPSYNICHYAHPSGPKQCALQDPNDGIY